MAYFQPSITNCDIDVALSIGIRLTGMDISLLLIVLSEPGVETTACATMEALAFDIIDLRKGRDLLLKPGIISLFSLKSFERIQSILNVCLASLSPLTLTEIYQSVNSAFTENFLSWEEFVRRIETISQLLLERRDGKFVLFHPAFREWLSRREEGHSTKFLADTRLVSTP